MRLLFLLLKGVKHQPQLPNGSANTFLIADSGYGPSSIANFSPDHIAGINVQNLADQEILHLLDKVHVPFKPKRVNCTERS